MILFFFFLSENKSKNELIYPSFALFAGSQLRDIMNPKILSTQSSIVKTILILPHNTDSEVGSLPLYL